LDIPIPNHLVDQISDRCLRCYKEQQWYGENFLYDFIGDTDVAGQRILEIGCAEAGLLKFYQEKGAICSGLELSDVRFNNAILLNQANHFIYSRQIFVIRKPMPVNLQNPIIPL